MERDQISKQDVFILLKNMIFGNAWRRYPWYCTVFFPADWGMLRRSRRAHFSLKTAAAVGSAAFAPCGSALLRFAATGSCP